jgi:hypothetical protein
MAVAVWITLAMHMRLLLFQSQNKTITLYKRRGKRKTGLCNGSDGTVASLLHGGFVSIPGKACGIYGKPRGKGTDFSSSYSVSLSI